MGEENSIKGLVAASLVTISLAVGTLMGIAIINQFKDANIVGCANLSQGVSGCNALLINNSADNFITGLAIFGTFMSIITLGFVVKIVISLVK